AWSNRRSDARPISRLHGHPDDDRWVRVAAVLHQYCKPAAGASDRETQRDSDSPGVRSFPNRSYTTVADRKHTALGGKRLGRTLDGILAGWSDEWNKIADRFSFACSRRHRLSRPGFYLRDVNCDWLGVRSDTCVADNEGRLVAGAER